MLRSRAEFSKYTNPCICRTVQPGCHWGRELPLSHSRICWLSKGLLSYPFHTHSTKTRLTGTISNSLAQGWKTSMLHVSRCTPDKMCDSKLSGIAYPCKEVEGNPTLSTSFMPVTTLHILSIMWSTELFQMWGSYYHPHFLIRKQRIQEPN